MSLDSADIFTDDPLADLAALVETAIALKARRLLLLAGKRPVCRIGEKLSPPLTPHKLHFNQMANLATCLLNPEQLSELDAAGSIEVIVSIEAGKLPATVFFGDGSHNVIIFLD